MFIVSSEFSFIELEFKINNFVIDSKVIVGILNNCSMFQAHCNNLFLKISIIICLCVHFLLMCVFSC